MQVKTFSPAAKVFAALQDLSVIVQTGKPLQIADALSIALSLPLFAGKAWQLNFKKLLAMVETNRPMYTIIAKTGNSKLGHMAAFSTLPGVTCPGAGDCLSHCYSFTSWRYVAAYARQAQNAYLMRFNFQAIADDFATLKHAVDFRLYVDGDYSSAQDVEQWQALLSTRPDVKAYGYSKSFALLVDHNANGKAWAGNYLLNISGGHNASADLLALAKALPIVRGTFDAVSIGRKVKSVEHGAPATNKALREAYKDVNPVNPKAFTCPGHCHTCTPKGHACGLPSFKGVNIIIAVH
jgi:hypothetical protein